LKSHQLFKLWRSDKIFLFLALEAILCSKAEHAGDLHNKRWYWSLPWSLVEIPTVVWPVKAGQEYSIFSSCGYLVQRKNVPVMWVMCTTWDGTDHFCKVC
jgi:hypothetical protein